jgi:hypothetical protein
MLTGDTAVLALRVAQWLSEDAAVLAILVVVSLTWVVSIMPTGVVVVVPVVQWSFSSELPPS